MKLRLSEAGIHVFDRKTGLNVLVDDVSVPSDRWAAAPRHVSMALTNACDLSCSYCYAPKKPAMLDYETVKAWLIELDENGTLGVGFGGGEPTLYGQLGGLCQFAAFSTHLAVTLTSHAHHLHDEALEHLAGSLHFLRVSMDGIGTTYERARGRSFDALVSRIEAISALVPFGINYVVNRLTLPDLDRATALAGELGASEFLLLPEQPVGGRGGIDRATTQALVRWVAAYRGPVRLSVSESGADGLQTCDPLSIERGLRGYAHIDASGVLKASSFDSAGVLIGEGGIMRALSHLSAPGVQTEGACR